MNRVRWTGPLAGLTVVVLVMSLCAGCQGMKYGHIAQGAVGGALLGWIIGHQYHEDGNGALIGAGAGALVGLAVALDQLPPQPKEHLEEAAEDVHNGNALLSRGRLTPPAFREAGL
jgi:uncharacterized membrane protein